MAKVEERQPVPPDWGAPQRARREDDARMTFREQMLWLEQATRTARRLASAPTHPAEEPPPPPGITLKEIP
jgi:hypothetical protein